MFDQSASVGNAEHIQRSITKEQVPTCLEMPRMIGFLPGKIRVNLTFSSFADRQIRKVQKTYYLYFSFDRIIMVFVEFILAWRHLKRFVIKVIESVSKFISAIEPRNKFNGFFIESHLCFHSGKHSGNHSGDIFSSILTNKFCPDEIFDSSGRSAQIGYLSKFTYRLTVNMYH